MSLDLSKVGGHMEVVPTQLRELAARIFSSLDAERAVKDLGNHAVDDYFVLIGVGYSTNAIDRLEDVRAMLTAWAHAIANPRPDLMSIARWQHISPSTIRRRYTTAQITAIRSLLSNTPQLDVILYPFDSFTTEDLAGLSPELDGEIAVRLQIDNTLREARERATKELNAWQNTPRASTVSKTYPPVSGRPNDPTSDEDWQLSRVASISPSTNVLSTLASIDPTLLKKLEAWRTQLLGAYPDATQAR